MELDPNTRSLDATPNSDAGAFDTRSRIPQHPAARPLEEMLGNSACMRQVLAHVRAAARTRATVLITGETGTGKSLLARAIHRVSPRSRAPFVQTDCAALDSGTAASELFGHERGAFTGAITRHRGRLEAASSGTVFLDEVGELSARLQQKFLRVLQERTFERVGGTETLPLRARIIAATHRDLRREVARGRFRADLFFRLNVLRIHMPPLRERLDDLPALARRVCRNLAYELGRPAPELSLEFEARLCRHPWPGNVRELENVLQRCLAHSDSDTLGSELLETALGAPEAWLAPSLEPVSDLHTRFDVHEAFPAASQDHAETWLGAVRDRRDRQEDRSGTGAASERERILLTLRSTGGNVSRAARRLGLSRSTLRYRISAYGLHHALPRD